MTYSRVEIRKTFTGDLEAQGSVEMLAVQAGEPGSGYVALERIEGTLQGRRGGFAVLHQGTMVGEVTSGRWPISPGSGTGELKGISGEARIEIDQEGAHTLFLDYQLS